MVSRDALNGLCCDGGRIPQRQTPFGAEVVLRASHGQHGGSATFRVDRGAVALTLASVLVRRELHSLGLKTPKLPSDKKRQRDFFS